MLFRSSVSAFGGLGENVASRFKKGQRVNITGQLKQREYEKDGQRRTVYEVTANSVAEPVSRFNDNNSSGQQPPAQQGFQQAQNNIQSSFGSMEQAPF